MTEIEFSRPTRVEPLPRGGLELDIEANADERAALAKLNNLPGIERLSASFRIAKWRRGVHVEGELSARVTQTCVVSLEPFDVDIEEPIDARFLPPEAMPAASESEADEDAPDPHRRGQNRPRRPRLGVPDAGARPLSAQARRRVRAAGAGRRAGNAVLAPARARRQRGARLSVAFSPPLPLCSRRIFRQQAQTNGDGAS